jgi:protein JSN1
VGVGLGGGPGAGSAAAATQGKYMPPARRALAAGDTAPSEISSAILAGDSPLPPPSNYAPGFRRARAGTLPSNVQLAAQRFAATANAPAAVPEPSTATSASSFADQLRAHHNEQQQQQTRPHAASIAGLTPPVRPGLRHSATAAPTIASGGGLGERNSRLRSGSLTLPAAAGLSNAFGSSLFSSNWVPSSQQPSGPSLGNGASAGGGYGFDDTGADDYDVHVHTLDYLGLDDGHRTATLSELRSRTQAALTHNIQTPTARMRASTVSNPYRAPPPPSRGASSLYPPSGVDEDDLYDEYAGQYGGRPRVDSLGVDNGSYFPPHAARGGAGGAYKQNDLLAAPALSARPRAISVGILDDPMRTLTRRSSAADSLSQAYVTASDYGLGTPSQQQQIGGYAAGTPGGILKSESSRAGGRMGGMPSVHFPASAAADTPPEIPSPYLQAPPPGVALLQPGRLSPKSETPGGAAGQIQTPTRSLWIGNLDSSVTSEQLIHVFAPYGAIESLRLLPEKVRNLWIFFGDLDF